MTNQLNKETLAIDMNNDAKVTVTAAATVSDLELRKTLKRYHSTHNKFGIDDIMLWLKDVRLIN